MLSVLAFVRSVRLALGLHPDGKIVTDCREVEEEPINCTAYQLHCLSLSFHRMHSHLPPNSHCVGE